MLTYTSERPITAEEFRDVLIRSTLGERRPIDDEPKLASMLANADLLATCWDGDRLVGVARSVTDFSYCCYLSDLAVDTTYQRQGIGKRLIEETRNRLDPDCSIILLAAPAAVDYYPHIGFDHHPQAWILKSPKPEN